MRIRYEFTAGSIRSLSAEIDFESLSHNLFDLSHHDGLGEFPGGWIAGSSLISLGKGHPKLR